MNRKPIFRKAKHNCAEFGLGNQCFKGRTLPLLRIIVQRKSRCINRKQMSFSQVTSTKTRRLTIARCLMHRLRKDFLKQCAQEVKRSFRAVLGKPRPNHRTVFFFRKIRCFLCPHCSSFK